MQVMSKDMMKPKTEEAIINHRWSGWPGAFCLDCGVEDKAELALADNCLMCIIDPELDIVELCEIHTNGSCKKYKESK